MRIAKVKMYPKKPFFMPFQKKFNFKVKYM